MESIKYELKYCERCGTLKLRLVSSTTTYCLLCERLLARFRFGKRAAVAIAAGLAIPDGMKTASGVPLVAAITNPAGRVQ